MEIFQPLGINWIGPIDDISGVANVNRNVIIAAMKMGIPMKCTNALQFWSHLKVGLSKDKIDLLEQAKSFNFPPKQYVTVMSFPPHYVQQLDGNAITNISYSLFETNKIPINWPNVLNAPAISEVWVPCKFQLASYKLGGVDSKKIKYMPMGVDTDEFVPLGPKMAFTKNNEFNFLSIMDVSSRKNPEVLLRSYFEEFKDQDDVVLILKAYTGGADEGSRQGIRTMIKKHKEDFKSKAKVIYLPGFLSDAQFALLHRSVNVYVCAPRGEGWNLPALQSMACGVPCIMPKHTSQLDFGTDENCFWIDSTEVDITDPHFLALDARFYGHRWWEVDGNSLKKQMRFTYTNREELGIRGQKARAMAEQFSWKNSVRKMVAQTAKHAQRNG